MLERFKQNKLRITDLRICLNGLIGGGDSVKVEHPLDQVPACPGNVQHSGRHQRLPDVVGALRLGNEVVQLQFSVQPQRRQLGPPFLFSLLFRRLLLENPHLHLQTGVEGGEDEEDDGQGHREEVHAAQRLHHRVVQGAKVVADGGNDAQKGKDSGKGNVPGGEGQKAGA